MHLFIYHQQYIDYIQGINHIQIIENTKDIFNTRNADEAFLVFIRCRAVWKLNEYANFLSRNA